MDGGVSGTGTHLDLLAGAKRVLILALTDGKDMTEGMMTSHPGGGRQELEDLEKSGTEVVLRIPAEVDLVELMSADERPQGVGPGRTSGLGRRRAASRPSGAELGPTQPGGGEAGGRTEAATAPTRPPTARSWATVMALTMATEDDEPWLITQTPSTPSSMAPPVFSGSSAAARGRRWG